MVLSDLKRRRSRATPGPITRRLYLDLLKKSLMNEIGIENELRIHYLRSCIADGTAPDEIVIRDIRTRRAEDFEEYLAVRRDGNLFRGQVSECPYTMIGRKRLDNLELLVTRVIEERVPGDVIECGVWRGGASIFIRGTMRALGTLDRTLWLADSFRGLPKPEAPQDAGYDLTRFSALAIDAETVREGFRRFEVLDERVRFLEGWFADTLPRAPIERLALIRLDADLYKSTLDALEPLYPKLEVGGYVVVDDYGAFPPCREAIHEFRARHRITGRIETIDWTGVYWRKEP
jgi:O-methyltransferase